jgi:hypothetical protein
MVVEHVARVARHVEDLQRGAQRAQLFGDLTSGHARHDDIGEQQIDFALEPVA